MKKVNKDSFYKKIGDLDVIVSVIGNYPYTTLFLIRHTRKEIGRVVDHGTNKDSDYFLNN